MNIKENRKNLLRQISFYFLFFIVIFSSITFGSVSEPFISLYTTLGFISLFCLLISNQNLYKPIYFKKIALPYFAVILFIFISYFARSSLFSDIVLRSLISMSLYGAIFYISLNFAQDKKLSIQATKFLAYSTSLNAIYALMLYTLKINNIFWYDKLFYLNSATGTFVNKNTFAIYLAIGTIMQLYLFLLSFKQKGNFTLSYIIDNISFKNTLPLFCFILNITTIFLTNSRGGIICLIIGLFYFLYHCIENKRILYASFAFIIFASIHILNVKTKYRFAKSFDDLNDRVNIYRSTLSGILEKPLLGHGAGNFEYAFEKYKSQEMKGIVNHAHNSYLETIFELGMPTSVFLFLCFFYIYKYNFISSCSSRQNLMLASIFTMISFQSLFDFAISTPAIAIICSFLAGQTLKNYDVKFINKRNIKIYSFFILILIIFTSRQLYYELRLVKNKGTIIELRNTKNAKISDLIKFIKHRKEILRKYSSHIERENLEIAIEYLNWKVSY